MHRHGTVFEDSAVEVMAELHLRGDSLRCNHGAADFLSKVVGSAPAPGLIALGRSPGAPPAGP